MLFDQFNTIFDTPESVKKLEELILEMAVRGKLVPQDPNDEPANVLLEKIREEKERLIKEKKIKKEKPMPPIAEEEKPYKLPNGWEWVRLGEIGQIIGGGTPNTKIKEYFSDDEIAWLTPADLSGLKGKYISHGKRFISKLGLEKSSAQLLPRGSVLFSSRAPIGYVAIASNQLATNQGFKSCVPFIMELNQYIYYFLKQAAKGISEKASGTTFKEVSGKDVSNIVVPLPPLNEQKRIVEKVDQLMSFCEELKKRLEKKQRREDRLNISVFSSLEQSATEEELQENLQFVLSNLHTLCTDTKHVQKLRNAILSLAVKGKLVPQDPNDEPACVLLERIKEEKERLIKEKKIKKEKQLPPITEEEKLYKLPEGWKWVRLGEICSYIQRGKSPNYSDVHQIPVISQKCIQWSGFDITRAKFIDPLTIKNYGEERFIKEDDLLWNSTGRGTLGRINVFPKSVIKKYPLVVADSHVTVIRPVKKLVDSKYLYIWFAGPFVQNEIDDKSTGSTKQTELNLSVVKNYPLPLPPLNEQKRIVEKVEQLMALCDQLESSIKKVNEQKEILLHSILYQVFNQQDLEAVKA
jgi:type I restriction enzyme, S subunit